MNGPFVLKAVSPKMGRLEGGVEVANEARLL